MTEFDILLNTHEIKFYAKIKHKFLGWLLPALFIVKKHKVSGCGIRFRVLSYFQRGLYGKNFGNYAR